MRAEAGATMRYRDPLHRLPTIFVIAAVLLGVGADTLFAERYVRVCEATGRITTDIEYISSALSAFDDDEDIRNLVIFVAKSKGHNFAEYRVDLDLLSILNIRCCGIKYPKIEDYDNSFLARALRYIFGIDEYTVEIRIQLHPGPDTADYTGRPSASLRAALDRCGRVWETGYGLNKIEQMPNGEFR